MSAEARPEILLAINMAATSLAQLRALWPVHQATTHEGRMDVAEGQGRAIRAIITNGTTLISADLIDALPNLGIICAQGVGFEGIDLAAAQARGIVVTHGHGANAECVADHTLALMLALLRDIRTNDAIVRDGGWRDGDTMRPIASGKRLGILGLGDIGRRIARRAAAFNMTVAYHNRREMPESGFCYHASPLALAEWADILVVVVPGGSETRHLIGAAELAALGPAGFLVNVGRGSVVDTAALIAALTHHRLAGAALDVVEGEPVVPAALRALPNVLLTPHMAGRSPESTAATIGLVIDNLVAHLAGKPPVSPIPGYQAEKES